ncbi:MAG: FG-GAP repeat protein, partial [Thiohalophilus sp.]
MCSNFIRLLMCGLFAVALTACGGGGGGGGGGSSSPEAPELRLTPQSIKTFHFGWTDVSNETEYRLLENPDGSSGFTRIATIAADSDSHDLVVSLPKRINASYILQACNDAGCADSAEVAVSGALVDAIGYAKASNTEADDWFGYALALSDDGNTLAVGAWLEDSAATGIGGDESNDSASNAGAVYVFS